MGKGDKKTIYRSCATLRNALSLSLSLRAWRSSYVTPCIVHASQQDGYGQMSAPQIPTCHAHPWAHLHPESKADEATKSLGAAYENGILLEPNSYVSYPMGLHGSPT